MSRYRHVGPHIPPKPFSLALNNECRHRAKSLADVTSFDQLKSSKFVTRSDMDKWLAHVKDQHDRRPEWSSVLPELDMPFPQRTKVGRAWREYEVALRARPSAATIAFIDRVQKILNGSLDAASSINEVLDTCISKVRPIVQTWKPGCDDFFVRAVILYELQR